MRKRLTVKIVAWIVAVCACAAVLFSIGSKHPYLSHIWVEYFEIEAPASAPENMPFIITVRAIGKNGRVVSNYNGTIGVTVQYGRTGSGLPIVWGFKNGQVEFLVMIDRSGKTWLSVYDVHNWTKKGQKQIFIEEGPKLRLSKNILYITFPKAILGSSIKQENLEVCPSEHVVFQNFTNRRMKLELGSSITRIVGNWSDGKNVQDFPWDPKRTTMVQWAEMINKCKANRGIPKWAVELSPQLYDELVSRCLSPKVLSREQFVALPGTLTLRSQQGNTISVQSIEKKDDVSVVAVLDPQYFANYLGKGYLKPELSKWVNFNVKLTGFKDTFGNQLPYYEYIAYYDQ